jgi:hypothetical protein
VQVIRAKRRGKEIDKEKGRKKLVRRKQWRSKRARLMQVRI